MQPVEKIGETLTTQKNKQTMIRSGTEMAHHVVYK